MAKRKPKSSGVSKQVPGLKIDPDPAADTMPPAEYWEQDLKDRNDAQAAYLAKHGDELSQLYESIRSGSSASPEEQNDDDEILVEEHPQKAFLKKWFSVPGVKDHFISNLELADLWQLEVDQTHRNIAFYIKELFSADFSASDIRTYLFNAHEILPSEPCDLQRLEAILRQDSVKIRDLRNCSADLNTQWGLDGSDGTIPEWLSPPTPDTEPPPPSIQREDATSKTKVPTKPKRSTVRGERREKLIGALTEHHQYADIGCLNRELGSSIELLGLASVSGSTASAFIDTGFAGPKQPEAIHSDMIANFPRVRELADVDELVFWRGQVREAARSFADLAERFRLAPSRSRTPSILKHDINSVFAVQAGELLCHSWRRGMLSVYRPNFYLPEEGEARLRYVFSWFTFIRWHLAPIFNNRFRADWRSEFAPEMDQLRGQKDSYPSDFTTQFSDNHSELLLWRLGLYAEVQATACAILVDTFERLLEAIDQRLGQLPGATEVVKSNLRSIEPEPSGVAREASTGKSTAAEKGKRRCPKELDQAFFDAIRKWHGFDPTTMTCSNLAPITNQALADKMRNSPGKSTANRIEKFFDGKYDVLCSDSQTLAAKLATLGDTGINASLANALADTKAKFSKTEAKVLKKIADGTLDDDFLK